MTHLNEIKRKIEITPIGHVLIELITACLTLGFLIFKFRPLLLFKGTILTHDHFFWGYPVFQYFAENLINGHFPLWNPFSHGGEPFYPLLLQLRLLEPITLLTVYLMKWVTTDLVLMYNWTHFNQNMFMILGVYLLLRKIACNILIRVSLIPILLSFTFMFSSFRQPAVIYQFLYVPYIISFLFRIVIKRDYRWFNWLFLGSLIGLNWQSYYFSGVWIIILFFILGVSIFRRVDLKALWHDHKKNLNLFTTALIIVLMMLPNIVVLLDKNQYVFPARMVPADYQKLPPMGGPYQFESKSLTSSAGILMPYVMIEFAGSFASIWDFIQVIYPEGNWAISSRSNWLTKLGNPSEIYFYIGMLPWVIAIIGFAYGRHKSKKIWVVMSLGLGFLLLGPSGGLHRILYYLFPPLWFVRHTHSFVLFFVLTLLYFYVIGFNYTMLVWKDRLSSHGESFKLQKNSEIKNEHIVIDSVRFYASLFIYTCSYIGCLYAAAHLNRSQANYIFLIVCLLFIIGRYSFLMIGKRGLVLGSTVGHILSLLIFHFEFKLDPSEFIIKVIFIIIMPCGFFLLFKSHRGTFGSKYCEPILIIIFVMSLTGDIIHHLEITKGLYRTLLHPAKMFHFKTSVQAPRLTKNRRALLFPYLVAGQSMRYISLILREPHAFSPVESIKKQSFDADMKIIDPFEAAFSGRRWNSFLLPHHYFSFIHADIPFLAMKEMFAIEKPLFQFKEKVIFSSDENFFSYLNKLKSEEILQLFKKCVFVSPSDKTGSSDNPDHAFAYGERESFPLVSKEDIGRVKSDFSYVINEFGANSVEVTIVTDSRGALYWADGFDKRWHVYINGKKEHVYRANVNFKAVIVPKSNSTIRFVYKHNFFMISVWVFEITFILSILIGGFSWMLQGKNKTGFQ